MAEDRFDIARARLLDECERIAHGFFGHGGERHQFGYGGPGNPEEVAALRAAAANALSNGARLVAPHQTHSSEVLIVEDPWDDAPQGRPCGDALVTQRPGVALGIVTADCAPVLLADPQARVIGAAHAGWRGALGGVLENTIAAMEELGARRERMVAAIGPCIAQESYEVDEGFRARFDEAASRFFRPGRAGHWWFDLPGYVAARLAGRGLLQIAVPGLDTYALGSRFYSYRRAVHRGEEAYGRQISLIALA